ncbi:MAG: alpha/beta fold hydrolase [Acidimicrobiaceae bacterium]|nr:alpha/beta fold hydrolase [Acidimicrobiaceae bacterium]
MAGSDSGFGVQIHSEVFEPVSGAPEAGAVLLVSGADSHCTRWTSAFIQPLLDLGHRVVRYDHRDSGLSTKVPADVGYTLADLADDACAVMDEHGILRAHVVGRSMGGMVGQVMALDHADRVATLTLLGSSPGLGDESLPSAADWLVDRMAERLFAPPAVSHTERVAWIVELDEMFAGDRYPITTAERIRTASAEVERCWYPESGHGPAVNSSPSRLGRLAGISVPTLVVHGTADPVFPVEHALALADGIPDAGLWLVEGLGHEVPDGLVPELLDRIREYLAVG